MLTVENEEMYQEAMEVLNKKKENDLIIVNQELKMRREYADMQAEFEKKRVIQLYEVLFPYPKSLLGKYRQTEAEDARGATNKGS